MYTVTVVQKPGTAVCFRFITQESAEAFYHHLTIDMRNFYNPAKFQLHADGVLLMEEKA